MPPERLHRSRFAPCDDRLLSAADDIDQLVQQWPGQAV